jgi:GGDEF domain-containing protein
MNTRQPERLRPAFLRQTHGKMLGGALTRDKRRHAQRREIFPNQADAAMYRAKALGKRQLA